MAAGAAKIELRCKPSTGRQSSGGSAERREEHRAMIAATLEELTPAARS